MAHFYGSMQGSRGEATRCGTKNSGIHTSARSWTHGVEVGLQADQDGDDLFCISVTSGSNGGPEAKPLYLNTEDLADLLSGRIKLALVPVNVESEA